MPGTEHVRPKCLSRDSHLGLSPLCPTGLWGASRESWGWQMGEALGKPGPGGSGKTLKTGSLGVCGGLSQGAHSHWEIERFHLY